MRLGRALIAGGVALSLTVLTACSGRSSLGDEQYRPIRIPSHATVYFFGDSWTDGYSADSGKGYAWDVAERHGWHLEIAPTGAGTGYVHTFNSTPVYPVRAGRLTPITADLVLLQGGLNDDGSDLAGFHSAMVKTIRLLRSASNNAPIIVVGPCPPTGTPSDSLRKIDGDERAVSAQLGLPYISPVQESWMTTASVKRLIDPRTGHPNNAGHALYAARLDADLRTVLRQGLSTH